MSDSKTVSEIASELVLAVDEARDWLLKLDETTIRHRPTPDRWSISEVIGHLVDSATNNHQRFIRGQELDELVFPKYEQNSWVEKSRYQEFDWEKLVEVWLLYNHMLAGVIAAIPEDQLATPCTVTPYKVQTLEFLVTDYLSHLRHHLRKIQERVS